MACDLHAERLELLERGQRVLDRLVLAAVLFEGFYEPARLVHQVVQGRAELHCLVDQAGNVLRVPLRREVFWLVVSVLAWPFVAVFAFVLVGSLIAGAFLGVSD